MRDYSKRKRRMEEGDSVIRKPASGKIEGGEGRRGPK